MRAPPRLLVVDDQQPIVFAISSYFRQQGFQVEAAVSAREARHLLRSTMFDVAITDLRLEDGEDLEGLELAHFLRRSAPDTRVIILTAHGDAHVQRRAAEHGVHAFLSKPMPLAALTRVVTRLLEDSHG